jgi:hypothetical protein
LDRGQVEGVRVVALQGAQQLQLVLAGYQMLAGTQCSYFNTFL